MLSNVLKNLQGKQSIGNKEFKIFEVFVAPFYKLQWKSHLCILFWELRGLSPNFHSHVYVSDLYIHRIGPHIFL